MNNVDNMEQQLWSIANVLRGNMDSSEFKNYMLGLVFFKYLSSRLEKQANLELENEEYKLKYIDLPEDDEVYEALKEELIEQLGYFIKPSQLFSSFVGKVSRGETLIEELSSAFLNIENSAEGRDSQNDLQGLFGDVDLNNNRLGNSLPEKNEIISKIISRIEDIEGLTDDVDTLGKVYEYAIKNFASDSGKKGGEFYTPTEVSELLSRLVTVNKKTAFNVYDPACGSGSLLIKAAQHLEKYTYIKGQELNTATYNLARMNMFLHGINYNEFDIRQGNTLINDKFKAEKFDVIVANPPFGVKWDATPDLLENDERFAKYGKLAPKSKGEFAFLQHMLYHLTDSGIMASVVPHGVLFRGAAELTIRKYMIEKDNVLDAVIGLPANLFYGTGIPAVILVFKKCREHDDIMFIDASREFEKVKTQNILTEENLQKIVETYKTREDIEKYSQKVSMEEIIENEYNLNIPRYIDTFEEEEPIDIDEVNREIARLEKEADIKKQEIEKMLVELGL